jgi:phosphatidylglycerol:prolipoprotein diacylglycerol transferase
MRAVLFHWRGIEIHSYSAMLYVGIVAGVFVAYGASRFAGLDGERVILATCALAGVALIGARGFYAAVHWPVLRGSRAQLLARRSGGATQYGAFLVAFPVSVPLLGALGLSFGAFWDSLTFAMLSGMAFVRVGCLLHGCCAGRPTDGRWGLRLANARGEWRRRIPAQLFEIAWLVLLLGCAVAVWRPMPFPGALFLLFTALYAAGRVVLVALREEHPSPRAFTLHQKISVALVLLSLAALTAYWPS